MMKITLLGTGTSFPDPERVQSGILVEEGTHKSLIDVGSGVLQRLNQSSTDILGIDSVMITHFHIDHCSDFVTLCQSLWLSGYKRTLHLYGPPSIKEWMRGVFQIAFPYIIEKILIEAHPLKENEALQIGPFAVATSTTVHSTIDTRAFRVEYKGRSFAVSGDTAPCRDIIELARGVDVLVHECNWLDGNHPVGVHTSPSELMSIVEESEPKKVVLTHVSPEVVADKDKVLSIVSRRSNAEVIFGEDLMTIEI
jgi:ribonuclease BN (tRNA processing enzyme)